MNNVQMQVKEWECSTCGEKRLPVFGTKGRLYWAHNYGNCTEALVKQRDAARADAAMYQQAGNDAVDAGLGLSQENAVLLEQVRVLRKILVDLEWHHTVGNMGCRLSTHDEIIHEAREAIAATEVKEWVKQSLFYTWTWTVQSGMVMTNWGTL